MQHNKVLPKILTDIVEGKVELKCRLAWASVHLDVHGHGEWTSYIYEPIHRSVEAVENHSTHDIFYWIEHDNDLCLSEL